MNEAENHTVKETSSPPIQLLDLVTVEDFRSVNFNLASEDASHIDVFPLSHRFGKLAANADEAGDEQARKVFRLLEGICSFHFRVEDRGEPFGPMMVMDGKRSMIPADCRGEQSRVLYEVLDDISHPGLRARVADTIWTNHPSLGHGAQVAIEAYVDCVEGVLAGTFKHRHETDADVAYETLRILKRAFQIAASANKNGEIPERAKRNLDDILAVSANALELTVFRRASELGLSYGVLDAASVASSTEVLIAAAPDDTDPYFLQSAYSLAAEAHLRAGNGDASRECRLKAAEQYVALADIRKASAMVASSFLMDAIQALRRVKGTKERRKELERKLRELQADSLDEMGSFGTHIDLSDLATGTIKVFDPLTLPQMLAQLANLCRSPELEDLKAQALALAKDSPLSAIFAGAKLDNDGKVISRNPGLSGRAEPTDEWFKHRIAQAEGLRREVAINGQFEPVRHYMATHYALSERHFMVIAELSPFVPTGHEYIFALGFARLMQGDFVSAAHLLLPQLENSIRYVLKQHGEDASMIQADMIQEDRSLSVLLTAHRQTLEHILGESLIFEIDLLFNDRAGSALRHETAHGKLTAGHCHHSSVIYACWLIYRITCLPLLKEWHDLVGRRLEHETF